MVHTQMLTTMWKVENTETLVEVVVLTAWVTAFSTKANCKEPLSFCVSHT